MIKAGLSNKYKVDPYGTEEILSEASASLAPKMTIDYGDEIQEAEFTFRPTKGSLDTNISPIAIINSIQGNSMVWNQLIQNGNFADGTQNWTGYQTTISVQNNMLTAVVGGTQTFPGIYQSVSLADNHVLYLACDIKIMSSASLIRMRFSNSSMNAYFNVTPGTKGRISRIGVLETVTNNNLYIAGRYGNSGLSEGDSIEYSNIVVVDLTQIYGLGNEPTTPEQFETDYYKWFGKQLTYEDYDTGSLRNCKMSGVKTTDGNSNMLCITPIPVTSLKGKLNGQGSSVVIFADGIKSAGDVRDEIKIENNILKGIKRIDTRAYESGDATSSTMTTDGISYTNYALATPEEYVIDNVSVEKVMFGSTEITKVYLGDQLIFESN